ncbi:MAG: hypothetical protein RIM80_05365 [Alphaproteobacteria bacterium]
MTSDGLLAAAVAKLTDAVAAAESAAAARNDGAGAGAAESVELRAALDDLRREHAGLKSVAADVTRRLDGAIGQVEAILSGRK